MGLLTDFRLAELEKHLGVYGINVYQNGKILAEHKFRRNTRVNLCSASKAFSSVGIGIAENEGRLKLTDHVLDYFPEYKEIAYPGSEKMTIRDLLQMRSGHMVEEMRKFNTIDRAELFFRTEIKEEPGTKFFYENTATYMLGRIIEKITDLTMRDYLVPRLFDKLEIVNPQWETCLYGHTICSGALYLNHEELSRLGIMLLHHGVYKDQQIVPADYVKRMYTDIADTSHLTDPECKCGYGYQVWMCTPPNTYRADGAFGQKSVVLLDYNAVISCTSHNETNHVDICRAMWAEILPYLEKVN
jgi:CubicO group peptidase (beta-lactamase class C family)